MERQTIAANTIFLKTQNWRLQISELEVRSSWPEAENPSFLANSGHAHLPPQSGKASVEVMQEGISVDDCSSCPPIRKQPKCSAIKQQPFSNTLAFCRPEIQ